jgi:hypothetical protein
MVRVNVPVGEFAGSVTVRVESKSGVADVVLRTVFAPGGAPETVRVTGELNPFNAPT